MQRRRETRILSCSHSTTFIEGFSRQCRNAVDEHHNTLGYSLAKDSKGVDRWATDEGGEYVCCGVGSGISGIRYDFGLIDDYIGSQEDADSKTIRDKQWDWLLADFLPRGKPNAIRIIVANRRHEDDLVGRLLENEPDEWELVSVPYFAEQDDPLGREEGARLWPEYFTEKNAEEVRRKPPRVFAGLYQQRPSPEDGNYFIKEWLLGYTREDLQKLMLLDPPIYGAGDWAVSEEKDANRTCLGGAA